MALCLMKRLQLAGNKPIALIGGGTGMIGDPSGRTDMRQMLTPEMMFTDADAFYEAVAEAIADDTADRRDSAEDYEIEFIGVEETDEGKIITTVIAASDDGTDLYTINLGDFYELLTRYARIVWSVSLDDAEDAEDEEEEEDEEDEDSEAEEESDESEDEVEEEEED